MDSKLKRIGDGDVWFLPRRVGKEDLQKWTEVDILRESEAYSEFRARTTAESVANFVLEDEDQDSTKYQVSPNQDSLPFLNCKSELAIVDRRRQAIKSMEKKPR